MEEKKKKVLLIKLSSLGDVIFNIPLASTLKDAGYEVTWLVSERGYQVVNNNPCVDKTILAPVYKWRKNRMSFDNIKEFFHMIREIRAEKYDIAIDSQMMLKSLFWTLLCGAKRRIASLRGRELSFLGGNEWLSDVSYHPDMPIVLNYLRYAQHLGLEPKIKVSLPARTEEQVKRVDELLNGLDKSKPLVVIAPATTWDNKHWNKDNWKIVVNNLLPKCNVVFTGGPNDNELIEYINENKCINLAGKTDLMELIEVFSRANVVISPDSGSAHLAWATGNPAVVTIFTCTPKKVLAPYGNPDKYVALGGEGLACQPCFRRKCYRNKNKYICTEFPSPKNVVNVVQGLIFN